MSVLRHRRSHFHSLRGRMAAAARASNGDRVDAAGPRAGTLGAQVHVMRVDDLPVGRYVAVAESVDRLVARDGGDRAVERESRNVSSEERCGCELTHVLGTSS